MKQKIKEMDYKHKITIFTFILFLVIGILAPISGDDWKSYIIGKQGILECFKNIDIKDGRIISGFLIPFLSYHKIIFDILFALLISSFVHISNTLLGKVKTKYQYLHPLIAVLAVSTFMFSYNYVSVTSTVAYTFPILLFIIYFYIITRSEEQSIKNKILLFLISIFITLSSIHIGIAFLLANLIYFVLTKNKKNIYSYFLVILDLILLIISMSLIENNLVITDYKEVLSNIPNTIENIFSKNIITIIIGAIPINMYLYEKLKERTYVRVIITLFDMILVFSLCYNFFNYVPFNINLILKKYNGIFATENWYYIFYFITYIALFIISINHFIKNKKDKTLMNILCISSILITVFSLNSYLFDLGNIALIIFTVIIATNLAIKEGNIGVHIKSIRIITLLLALAYLSMFGVIKYIDVTRSNYIKEQIEYDSNNIEVKANPIYLVWRYNPVDYFQHRNFKEYYEIDQKNSIEVKYFGVFEKIEKRVKR